MRTYPIYMKAAFLLLLAFLMFYALVYAEFILVPLTFGSLFSILLTPVATKFEKWGAHRTLSSFLCIIIMGLILTILIFLLTRQIVSFLNNLPELTARINCRLNDIQAYITRKTNLSPSSQMIWLKNETSTGGTLFKGALSATTSTFATVALIPLYTFFILFYRDRIQLFIEKIIREEDHETVYQITHRIQQLVQSYLSGIIIVIFIVAIIISTGLKIIGVPYAIFLGAMAGILNVIPYLGILTAAALSVVIATITMDSSSAPLFVFLLFLGMHMLEANIITPNIVGSKVSINPLASLLALIIGEEVWGIVGMILFIPLLGTIKVVLDNFKSLEPYGYLLGMETSGKHIVTWKGTLRKIKRIFTGKAHSRKKPI